MLTERNRGGGPKNEILVIQYGGRGRTGKVCNRGRGRFTVGPENILKEVAKAQYLNYPTITWERRRVTAWRVFRGKLRGRRRRGEGGVQGEGIYVRGCPEGKRRGDSKGTKIKKKLKKEEVLRHGRSKISKTGGLL